MKAIISLLFLLALSCSLSASPQTTKHKQHGHSEKTDDCASTKMLPSVKCAKTASSAFDKDGKLWLVWSRSGHIYVQSSIDKGQSFSDPVAVNRIPEKISTRGENRPKIKVDSKGTVFLTWTSGLAKRFSSNIRFSRSTDNGISFSQPVTINDNLEVIGHSFDSMAVAENGDLFIAWLDARDNVEAKKNGQEFVGTSLYYTWSEDSGKTFHANKKIAAHTCQCCRLQSAIDVDGNPVISWRHIFEGGLRDHAIVKFKDWETPGEVIRMSYENWEIDACPHHGGGLAVSGDGTYHAAWFSNSATKSGLFYGYSINSGEKFNETEKFGNPGAGHPHVVTIDNNPILVWLEFDGKQSVIQLMKSNDAGRTWEQPEVIATTDKMADRPFLLKHKDQAFLAWQTEQQGYQIIAISK